MLKIKERVNNRNIVIIVDDCQNLLLYVNGKRLSVNNIMYTPNEYYVGALKHYLLTTLLRYNLKLVEINNHFEVRYISI